VLLDEPTNGNQPSIIDEIADLLHVQRQMRGLAITFVEQNLDGEVVLHICEEVWPRTGSPRLGSVRQAEWTRAWAARYALTDSPGQT
jgi:ABC-type dipeptide/oligopeptide/nickel transport system ATPase subunit